MNYERRQLLNHSIPRCPTRAAREDGEFHVRKAEPSHRCHCHWFDTVNRMRILPPSCGWRCREQARILMMVDSLEFLRRPVPGGMRTLTVVPVHSFEDDLNHV